MSTGQAEGQPAGDDRLESTVGQYRIVRRIGQGGMGVVYEAVHRTIGQRAAIKVLAAAGTRRANYFERFANEARAASAVAHPGLVKVFDFGKLPDGTPYILMEYLEGELLRTRMERLKKLPLEMAVQVIRQIASALSAVHAGGIVHRDVKPENVIMVADDASDAGERPKLLDFGVARLDSGSSSMLTDPGMVVGTPVYMSPEQCCGGIVDWASDVYSLGVMACEMLSGKLPHAAQGAAVMQAHVDEEPRPQLLEGVPEPIAALVFRMLAKQSWHRPTAAVVASELQMPRNGTMPFVFAPTVEGSVREAIVKKPAAGGRRRRALGVGASLVGLAALVAGGAVLVRKAHHAPGAAGVELSGMVHLRGGAFTMGLTPAQVDAELAAECAPGSGCKIAEFYQRARPSRQVTVSPFYLDVHEVTNGDVADWLNLAPSLWTVVREEDRPRFIVDRRDHHTLLDLYPTSSGIELVDEAKGVVRARARAEALPVVQISWDGAVAYCEKHGKRLPTEAEWEFAARGVAKRTYPWGDAAPSCETVTYGRYPGGPCEGRPAQPDDVNAPTRDVTPEGIRSLGGNVSEWVADALTPFYGDCGKCVDPRVDASGPPESNYRIYRGAAYDADVMLKTTRRGRWNQATPANTIGFRCAADGK